MSENDALIYGKDTTQGIVSIEIENEKAIVFTQDENGNILESTYPNAFWILADRKIDEYFERLDGELHYKWATFLTDEKEFNKLKSQLRAEYGTFHVNDHKEAFMLMSGMTYFKGLQHKQVSVLAFDIETTGLKLDDTSKVLIIANTFRDSKGNIEHKLFAYDDFNNDKEMFEAWCSWVVEKDPSIMLGHNVFGFDLPYISHCAELCGASLTLGRKGKEIKYNNWESKFRKDGSQTIDYKKCHIYGRNVLDTMFLSVKYDVARNYESYGLKAIIKHEGLEIKDRQFYDAGQIWKNYKNQDEWKKIKAYAIQDGDDALALYDLMSAPFFYLTQSIPKSYQEVNTSATGSQINSVMMRAYLQNNHSIPFASESKEFEGAISLGNPGIYRNVNKSDIASLYPSIMIQYEVYDKNKDPLGFFKTLVKVFTERRLEHKKLAKTNKYYDDLQSSGKIFINSCYGFLGATGLVFNSPENAALITRKGREILQRSINWVKEKNFILVNCDTDAVGYCKSDMSIITEEEQVNLLNELNSLFPAKIRFEPDGYFPTFIVLKAKNYVMYDGQKIKTKGSALKDSKKELAVKDLQKDIISSIIYDKSDMTEIYNKYIKEASNIQDIKRWCSKKTITQKIFSSERSNETKILDAISGTDYKEADKIWLFFKPDDTLCLAENFTGEYDKSRMYEKLYKGVQIFDSVLPTKELFLNYSLKRNQKKLEEMLNDKN